MAAACRESERKCKPNFSGSSRSEFAEIKFDQQHWFYSTPVVRLASTLKTRQRANMAGHHTGLKPQITTRNRPKQTTETTEIATAARGCYQLTLTKSSGRKICRAQRASCCKLNSSLGAIPSMPTQLFSPAALIRLAITLASLKLFIALDGNHFCHCDTPTTTTTTHQRLAAGATPLTSLPLPLAQQPKSEVLALPPVVGGALAVAQTTHNHLNGGHKENLFSSLSDAIERQHFMMKPIRALVHQRPSKFDSGRDSLLEVVPPLLSSSSSSPSSLSPSSSSLGGVNSNNLLSTSEHHHQANSKSKGPDSDGLRQIMRMHELAASASAPTGPHKANPAASIVDVGARPTKLSWRDLTQNPIKIVHNLLGAPNKLLLSSVLSHLTSIANNTETKQSAAAPHTSLPTRLSLYSHLNPFSARASAQASHSALLAGLGQSFLDGGDSPTGQLVAKLFFPHASEGPPLKGAKATNVSEHQEKRSPESKQQNQQAGRSNLLAKLLAVQPARKSANDHYSVLEATSKTTSPSSTSVASEQLAKGFGSASMGSWLKDSANQLAQSYLFDSFRDLLTLSQLPILSASGPVSTAPSELEPGGKQWLANRVANQQVSGNKSQTTTMEDLFRFAYILGTGVRRKRDPLKALSSSPTPTITLTPQTSSIWTQFAERASSAFSGQKMANDLMASGSSSQGANRQPPPMQAIRLAHKLSSLLAANNHAKPRGVMWDMATDPSLAVTVFHLLERASVALPLGFLLMPFVQMIRNPLNGFNLARIIPARASHRSIDYEELAKRLDMVDKVLSRALRPTHREATLMGR